jgi:hypothetical protein
MLLWPPSRLYLCLVERTVNQWESCAAAIATTSYINLQWFPASVVVFFCICMMPLLDLHQLKV